MRSDVLAFGIGKSERPATFGLTWPGTRIQGGGRRRGPMVDSGAVSP
jgi:hypothetical protein